MDVRLSTLVRRMRSESPLAASRTKHDSMQPEVPPMARVLPSFAGAMLAGALLHLSAFGEEPPPPALSRAEAEPLPAGAWAGKPVVVAQTVAKILAISPDGKRFLFFDGRRFGCFDRAASELVWSSDSVKPRTAAFAPDGQTIVTAEWEHGVVFYAAATGAKLYAIPPGAERAAQAAYRPDGTALYHTSDPASNSTVLKYTIVHYDPVAKKEIGKRVGSIKQGLADPRTAVWHRGTGFHVELREWFGTRGTERTTVSHADPLTGKASATIVLGADDYIFDLRSDGKQMLLTTGSDLRLVDTADGATVLRLEGTKRPVADAAFSPNAKYVVAVTGTEPNEYRGKVPGPISDAPAEVIVWESVTGKVLTRSEFPTTERNFVSARFSPDSKFVVAVSKEQPSGSKVAYAFGKVPFGARGVALNFPADDALKPKPVGSSAARVIPAADSLDKLVQELARSTKTTAERVDVLFLATLGRFATGGEQKRVREHYGDKIGVAGLLLLAGEITATPEYDAHVKALLNRLTGTTPGRIQKAPLAPFSPFHLTPGGWPNSYPYGWSGPWSWPNFPPPAKP